MVTVAGVGPGNPKYISLEVIEKIREFKYVVAFPRIATSLKDIREDIIVAKRVEDVLSLIDKQEEILLLASGDPNFYGIVEFLKRKKIKIREILPGLTSFQYMMAKLGKAWQGAHFLSLHGREESLEGVRNKSLCILLTDKANPPSIISERLKDLGIRGKMHIGFDLSYEEEVIKSIGIGDKIKDQSALALVVIENEMA